MESIMHIYDVDSYDEKEYIKMKKQLKTNDVFMFRSLNSIGQSYDDIQKELAYLTKKIKVDIVVLDMPLFDTRVNKEVNGTLIADLASQMLGYSLKVNNTYRKQRQTEGIAQAQASGVKFGRPRTPLPKGFDAIYDKILAKEITITEGAKRLGIEFHQMRRFIEKKKKDK